MQVLVITVKRTAAEVVASDSSHCFPHKFVISSGVADEDFWLLCTGSLEEAALEAGR